MESTKSFGIFADLIGVKGYSHLLSSNTLIILSSHFNSHSIQIFFIINETRRNILIIIFN